MALVVCPDCGRQVSDAAPSCPSCGRPIASADAFSARMAAPGLPAATAEPTPKWYHRTFVVGILLLLFFPLGAILLWTAPRTGFLTKLGGTVVFGIIWLAIIGAGHHDHSTAAADTSSGDTQNSSALYKMVHASDQPAQPVQATRVAVNTLLSEYSSNEVRADANYKGRWITTTGYVGDVKKDMLDNVYMTVGTGAEIEFPIVQCFVAKDQIPYSTVYSKGSKVTVTGRVDGLLMNVIVKDCRFQ